MSKLTSERKLVSDLTKKEIETMYSLMATYYDGVTKQGFENDLEEKEEVAILKTDNIKGFSTIMSIDVVVDEKPIKGIFSGDTIIHSEYWGSQELVKQVGSYMFEMMNKCEEVYWLLISKGYKTYKYLPIFFEEFHPNPYQDISLYEQKVLDTLAHEKFGSEYHKEKGLVIFSQVEKLKAGVADVSSKRLKDPYVRHFLECNPYWKEGNELVCLARLSEKNFRSRGKQIIKPYMVSGV